ncbi:MAG TPA: PSD1 and planctomycete cytochrome C domain-containing protein [Tepidisphaeraceae bacterium]
MSRMLGLGLLTAFALAAPARAADTPQGFEYFEKHVRPILVDSCYKCHSAKSEKLKGGLYVDTRQGLLKGGKTGPAIVPGDLDKSLLIKAVRYTDDDLQMPPKEQLSKEQVAVLEAWVKMGAPDPRTSPSVAEAGAAPPTKLSLADAKNFWSMKKPVMPAVPVARGDWAKSPIDAFVLEKLDAAGLEPAPPADKRTLIRRATLDLTGLPPTAAEVEAFEADASPNAFEKVIDRLLASPAYGERWARHWLDLARYADTKGYVFQEERRYPYAYTYRDWVVRALNEDIPYDQFLIHQIAADRVVAKDPNADRRNLAAMGFLTLGRRFLNNQADIIDDRLDVVFRGTMGLTVACARCHDHKFDPIPTADYYSLYGVFASSVEPTGDALPLLETKEKSPQTIEYEKELAARQAEIAKFNQERFDKIVPPLRTAKVIEKYLLAAGQAKSGDRGEIRQIATAQDLRRGPLERWRNLLAGSAGKPDPVFAPFHALMAIPEKELAAAPIPAANKLVLKALIEEKPKSRADVARVYAELFVRYDKPQGPSDPDEEALRQVLRGPNSPVHFTVADVEQLFNRDDRNRESELKRKRDALMATHPGAPARAMVLQDAPTPVTPVIFKRGNPAMPAGQVPRQFLACVAGEGRQPFKEGSGRLELAQAIASKDNPLTARVFVNRVWLEHFGKGLVRTPSDFGIRGERPTHPELLDYLAVKFMQDGWSIKKLQKTIMLSATYQQSSIASAKAIQADADNRLLSHQNRQRLDFEGMRDSILFVSGQLDRTVGGKAIDLMAQPFTHRRTIYGFVDRQNLPSMFRAFDFASPDTHAPRRFTNTVPQQALFMMNSPFVVEQARALAGRINEITAPADKVRGLYRAVLARDPSKDEIELGLQYVNGESTAPSVASSHGSVWQYGYGEYDATSQHLRSFTPLPQFTGSAYQGGKAIPDPKLGYCLLTPQGGHAGNDAAHAVVRRFTAPRDGQVTLSGTLAHASPNGDGVRGRIVSSRFGELATLAIHNKSAQTQLDAIDVKAGDTIDFIVDCRKECTFDSFTWNVNLKMKNIPETVAGGQDTLEWDSQRDFAGPVAKPGAPLSPWEKYAQILLETNEFVFVD